MHGKLSTRTKQCYILLFAFCFLVLMGCGKKADPVQVQEDTTPPRVLYAYPADSSSGAMRNTVAYVAFSEPMDKSSAQGAFSAGGASGAFHWFGNSLVLVPASPFPADDTVRLGVSSAAQDLAGNGLSPAFSRWFVTGAATDVTRPTVSALDPAAGSTNQPVGITVKLRASESILQFLSGGVSMADSMGNPASGNTSWQDSVTVVFNPTSDLAYNTLYTVTVDTILRDLCWNRNETASWQFRTEIDATLPTVVSINPANGATGVSLKDSILITFSEPMDTASVRAAFGIAPAISGTFAWNGQNVVKFTMSKIMAVNRAYTVTVSTGARDLAGNQMAASFSWSFTTDRVVYAACTQAGRVYVLARASGEEMQRLDITNPVDIACSPDGSKFYVITGGAAGSLKVLDPNNAHQEVRSVGLGNNPYAIDLSASGAQLAVSNYVAGTVTVIDTAAWGSPLTFAVDAGPHGVAFGNGRIFAACADAGWLSAYTTAGTFIQNVVARATSKHLCLSAGRDTIYLCEGDQVSAFAASDLAWLGSAATDCHDAVRAGAYLYVSDPITPRVRVYSPAPVSNIIGHIQDITVGSAPRGLCASSDGSRVFSANGATGTVSEISTASNAVVKLITVGAAVDAVAASP
jgi:DNA-binding beta-propeller fold protein YncE